MTNTTVIWLSTAGTSVMFVYQVLYFWGTLDRLPSWMWWLDPTPGSVAWLVGVAFAAGYAATKAPHLIGQEPGDALGLVREVILIQFNLTLVICFLTSAYLRVSHAHNAVGIGVLLFIVFVGLLITELAQGIVLSRRTWTDSSGAPTN